MGKLGEAAAVAPTAGTATSCHPHPSNPSISAAAAADTTDTLGAACYPGELGEHLGAGSAGLLALGTRLGATEATADPESTASARGAGHGGAHGAFRRCSTAASPGSLDLGHAAVIASYNSDKVDKVQAGHGSHGQHLRSAAPAGGVGGVNGVGARDACKLKTGNFSRLSARGGVSSANAQYLHGSPASAYGFSRLSAAAGTAASLGTSASNAHYHSAYDSVSGFSRLSAAAASNAHYHGAYDSASGFSRLSAAAGSIDASAQYLAALDSTSGFGRLSLHSAAGSAAIANAQPPQGPAEGTGACAFSRLSAAAGTAASNTQYLPGGPADSTCGFSRLSAAAGVPLGTNAQCLPPRDSGCHPMPGLPAASFSRCSSAAGIADMATTAPGWGAHGDNHDRLYGFRRLHTMLTMLPASPTCTFPAGALHACDATGASPCTQTLQPGNAGLLAGALHAHDALQAHAVRRQASAFSAAARSNPGYPSDDPRRGPSGHWHGDGGELSGLAPAAALGAAAQRRRGSTAACSASHALGVGGVGGVSGVAGAGGAATTAVAAAVQRRRGSTATCSASHAVGAYGAAAGRAGGGGGYLDGPLGMRRQGSSVSLANAGVAGITRASSGGHGGHRDVRRQGSLLPLGLISSAGGSVHSASGRRSSPGGGSPHSPRSPHAAGLVGRVASHACAYAQYSMAWAATAPPGTGMEAGGAGGMAMAGSPSTSRTLARWSVLLDKAASPQLSPRPSLRQGSRQQLQGGLPAASPGASPRP